MKHRRSSSGSAAGNQADFLDDLHGGAARMSRTFQTDRDAGPRQIHAE
jgi:hypothetical protein